jgi:streptogrisin C
MVKRVSRLTAVGCAVGVAALLWTTATATPALAGASGVRFQSAQEAFATDLALFARSQGWTVEQARAQHEAAERIGRVQQEVASRFPDAYVGGVLSSQPGGAPRLLLKGTANAAVRQLARQSGLVLADRQPYSLRELETQAAKAHSLLARMGYQSVATAVDIDTASIEVTVSRAAGLPASAATLRAAPGLTDAPAGLRLSFVDGPVMTPQLVFGGQELRDDGVFQCTTGWSLTGAGVTTAAHCPDGINQVVDGALVHSIGHFGEHLGAFGDVALLNSGLAEPDDFFATANVIRDVAAVEPAAGLTVGEQVCVFGRGSGVRSCTTIHRTSVSGTLSGVTVQRMVATVAAPTVGGDSGGGWSRNNTAFGSHVGTATFDGALRSVFSVADFYDEALGVTVRTS